MSSIIIKYLIEFINSLRKLSHEIIVTIDANKTFNGLNSELAKLCTKYNSEILLLYDMVLNENKAHSLEDKK